MKALRTVALLCLASPIATAAVAQAPQTPPAKGAMETITGAVGKMADNRFMIDTDSGPMLVTTGPKWHHRLDLKAGERVTVIGQAGGLDFDAFQIKRADGQVIEIRPAEGPPPWVMAESRGRGKGPPAWAGRGGDDRDGGPPAWAGRGGDDRDDGGRWNRRGPPPWAGPHGR